MPRPCSLVENWTNFLEYFFRKNKNRQCSNLLIFQIGKLFSIFFQITLTLHTLFKYFLNQKIVSRNLTNECIFYFFHRKQNLKIKKKNRNKKLKTILLTKQTQNVFIFNFLIFSFLFFFTLKNLLNHNIVNAANHRSIHQELYSELFIVQKYIPSMDSQRISSTCSIWMMLQMSQQKSKQKRTMAILATQLV